MGTELLPRVALAALGIGIAGYFGLSAYSQPVATYRQIKPVRAFLTSALSQDSAALAAQAGARQPIRWALAAVRTDSAAVREWAESRPRVTSFRRGDTLWVTLRRPGSTESCSPLYPLTAGFLGEPGQVRLVHLSSLCPSVSRAVK
jgi:hypothetical protein